MLNITHINSYLTSWGAPEPENKEEMLFEQNLDVLNTDEEAFSDCLLNTHLFQKAFVKERPTGKYVDSALLFLNSLNFNLKAEVERFKHYNGVINMNYAAALYLGGIYHKVKTNASFDNERRLGLTDGLLSAYGPNIEKHREEGELIPLYEITNGYKIGFTNNGNTGQQLEDKLVGHTYGVMNNLYQEWNHFMKSRYITGNQRDSSNYSVLRHGNWNGEIKTFYSTPRTNMAKADIMPLTHVASYAVLSSTIDFSSTVKNSKADEGEIFAMLIGHLKSMIRRGHSKDAVKNEISMYLRFKDYFLEYGKLGKTPDYTVADLSEDVYTSLALEVKNEVGTFSGRDFAISLFPSGGGLFHTGKAYTYGRYTDENGVEWGPRLLSNDGKAVYFLHPKLKNGDVYARSCRFIWSQANLSTTMTRPEPVVKAEGHLHRTAKPHAVENVLINNKYGVYGAMMHYEEEKVMEPNTIYVKTDVPVYVEEKLQNIMAVVGLQNLEYMEQEFLNWVNEKKKSDFADRLHFVGVLKAMTTVESEDFADLTLNAPNGQRTFTVDQQLAMLSGYNYTMQKVIHHEFESYLNCFLSYAQAQKVEKVAAEFLSSTFAVNNFTTVGLLKSGNLMLQLEQAPFRREFLFYDDYTSLDKGFLVRKILFGDQDVPVFEGDPTLYAKADKKLPEIKNILKYYDFRFVWDGKAGQEVSNRFNTIYLVAEFCQNINVSCEDENVLRLLQPIIGSYMAYYVKQRPNDPFNNFADGIIKHFTTEYATGFDAFMLGYQNALKNMVDRKGEDFLLSMTDDDRELLVDLKTATYYNVRAMFDNNLYMPNTNFYQDDKDTDFHDPNFLTMPLFYNYTKSADCGEISHDEVNGRSKHLYEYVKILDRGNRNVGHDILANLIWIREQFKMNKDQADPTSTEAMDMLTSCSFFSFFSAFASHHNALMHPLSSYVNLAGTEKDGDALFETYNTLELADGRPAFVIQYIGDMESVLNTEENRNTNIQNNRKQSPQNSFCLDVDFYNGVNTVKADSVPDDIKNGAVSCFVVDFGNQNQQVFKNIQIDTSQFTNTEESIKTYVNLVSEENKRQPASGDLFKILSQRSYTCQVESLGNVMIQPLSYFYIKNIPLFTGAYWIINVSHKLEANVMSTSFNGVRQPIAKIPSKNDVMLRILRKNAEIINEVKKSDPVVQNSVTNSEGTFFNLTDGGEKRDYNGAKIAGHDGFYIKTVMDWLQKDPELNLSYVKAAVITGNFLFESELNPLAFNSAGGGQGALGIGQWRAERQAKMVDRIVKKYGKDWKTQVNRSALIIAQLEHFKEEFMGPDFKDTRTAFFAATQVAELIRVFAFYELYYMAKDVDGMKRSLFVDNVEHWGKRVQHIRDIIGQVYPTVFSVKAQAAAVGATGDPSKIDGLITKIDRAKILAETSFPDSYKLSPNFTLGQLSTNAPVSREQVVGQKNLSKQEIVANLSLIATNILEPIRLKYPDLLVTSGFRNAEEDANQKSQHLRGEAVDIQFTKHTKKEYYAIAQTLQKMLPYHQFILEYKTTGSGMPWIHIGLKESGNAGQVMTFMNHRKKQDGLVNLA